MIEGVAIVGMSGRFPGAKGVRELWENLLAGKESISFFDAQSLEARDPAIRNPAYVPARGIIEDVDLFDAGFFGIPPREAELMDPQHRLFLECAWEALEDAGHDPARYPGPIGVYAGQSLSTYLLANLARDRAFLDRVTGEYQVGSYTTVLGNDKDYIGTRVCYRLDLGGPGMTIQCGCSTSLVAVCQAVSALLSYQCDMALAGGASITFPQRRGYLYNEGGMVAPDGHCRTFDAEAQGTVFSSGVSVVLLKRMEDALADGDHVYAVIKGSALNNDGARKVGYTAPSVDRQGEVVAAAQAVAGVSPESVGYVECHGTATPLGDPIEVAALTRAFRAGGATGTGYCALGSLKSNVGHMEVAGGAGGLIKAALVVKSGKIPATLHFQKPNPRLELEGSPFYVNARLAEWTGPLPRRAGVSAFGVGGTNAHVVLEEPPQPPAPGPSWPHQLLLVSARTPAALDAASARLAAALKKGDVDLADAACTLQLGRRHFAHRRAVVAASVAEAVSALESRDAERAPTGMHEGAAPPVAFLFPGQGAQSLGMGAGLYAAEPLFRAEVDRACEILQPQLGFDLRTLVFRPAPQDEQLKARLDQTEITQPALFVIEYALARLWMSWGLQPEAMIGHSVGEYVAACLSGVFSLEDALLLVAARGKLIQSLPPGAMLAVRLPESEVLSLLSPSLSIAAVNGPRLCVVSGPHGEVDKLESALASRGGVGRRLRTSHAFHSAMMDPVLEAFTERVRQTRLSPPRIPFISSPTGKWISEAEATDPAYWARHVRETVRFAEGVSLLPGRLLLEVGPGHTLSTLARQALSGAPAMSSLGDAGEQGGETAAFLDAAARLWLAGAQLDWKALQAARGVRRVPLPTYPFERSRYWVAPVAQQQEAPAAGAPAAQVDGDLERLLRAQLEVMSLQLSTLGEQGDA